MLSSRSFRLRFDHDDWSVAGSLFNVAAFIVPAVLLGAVGWWSWQSIEREAVERAQRVAATAADHARRVLETQDTILEAALSRVRDMDPAAIAGDQSVYNFLARLERHALSSSATSLTDVSNATILSSSASFPPPVADLSDRDYVKHFRSPATGTFIGGIVRGAASGRLGFTVSRRDGSSAVAAVTLVPLDGITTFYRTVRESEGDTLTLARADGTALVIPAVADPVGYRLPHNAVLMRLLRGEVHAPLRAVSAVDGVDRLWTHARVGNYPVHVIYGRNASTMRRDWLVRMAPLAVLAVLGSALLLVAGIKAQRALAASKLAELEVSWARARAQHAEAMRDSEARFKVLFEELPLPAWLIDPVTLRILDCNERAADLLGYSRDQMRQMRVPDFEARFDADEIARNEERIAKEGRLSLETRHRAADGTVHDMLVTAHSIRLGGRALTYANGVDITERKLAEERLRETEAIARERLAELEQTYRYSPVGLFTLDRDLRFVKVNQRMAELDGLSVEDHAGRSVEEVLGPAGARTRADLERILGSGEPLLDQEISVEITEGQRAASHFLASWYPYRSARGEIVGIAGALSDITERKLAENHIRLLMQEVNHRAKNMLSVIQAIARNTARSGDPATFMDRLGERIRGLAASQDLLVNGSWRGIDLTALVRSQLAHFSDLLDTRITIEGPSTKVSAAAAQAIGMAIHELGTNAGKYGALVNGKGTVGIKWSASAGELRMEWCESGGPPVKPPCRRGFGHTVIETMVASALQGKARLEYAESGVCWFLAAPYDRIADTGGPDQNAALSGDQSGAR